MQVGLVTPVVESKSAAPTDQHPQKHDTPFLRMQVTESDNDSRFKPIAEDGNEIVYRTVDPETGAVLTQVPSEEVVRVARKLEEMRSEGKIT